MGSMSVPTGLKDTPMIESVKSHSFLSLADAQASGRLEEFISQEQVRGKGPANPIELDESLSRLIKSEKSEDRTSRSASSDGSSETKTR